MGYMCIYNYSMKQNSSSTTYAWIYNTTQRNQTFDSNNTRPHTTYQGFDFFVWYCIFIYVVATTKTFFYAVIIWIPVSLFAYSRFNF